MNSIPNAELIRAVLPEIKLLHEYNLPNALWWFIENIDADHKNRSTIFFYLRERVRMELK